MAKTTDGGPKMKVAKKKKEAPAKPAKGADPKPAAFDYGEGKHFYRVELEGVKQGVILPADSKLEAKEKFFKLSGIISTDRVVVCQAVDEDHGTRVFHPGEAPEESDRESGPGIINYFPKPTSRKPRDVDEED